MTRNEKATQIINRHILWSMGAGAIPFPIVDLGAVTVVQLEMLKLLCEVYDVSYSKRRGSNMITALGGNALMRFGASFFKFVPGYGTIGGAIGGAIISGATTYALGQVFSYQLSNNGSLEDFDMDEARKMYEREYERGKTYARDLKERYDAERKGTRRKNSSRNRYQDDYDYEEPVSNNKATDASEDIFAKITKLGDLKDKGILTEDEFLAAKAKLLQGL